MAERPKNSVSAEFFNELLVLECVATCTAAPVLSIDEHKDPRENSSIPGTLFRAKIDASTSHYLFTMHGVGSVALLALVAVIIPNPDLDLLTRSAIIALIAYQFGIVFSVFHNNARRRCSNEYETASRQGKERPDPCRFLGLTIRGGCQCLRELAWRSLAIILFLFGSITVAAGAWGVLSQPGDDGMSNQARYAQY